MTLHKVAGALYISDFKKIIKKDYHYNCDQKWYVAINTPAKLIYMQVNCSPHLPCVQYVKRDGSLTYIVSIARPRNCCRKSSKRYHTDPEINLYAAYHAVHEVSTIAQFAITINSNVCPHIRVLNMLMRESFA